MAVSNYAAQYDPERDFDSIYTRATAKRIAPWLKEGDAILELGCATSLMTSCLHRSGLTFECVEKAEAYLEIAKRKQLAHVRYHHATLENFSTDQRFQHILMTNVLHELPDPAPMFVKTAGWLAPNGKIHVTLPNPESIHRKVALAAGMLKDLRENSARGQALMTIRLYYNQEVIEMARNAGLKLIHQDGILFKPLSNSQMTALDEKILDAFDAIAHEFPNNGAMTYFVFERSSA